jgi:hypothetical protein
MSITRALWALLVSLMLYSGVLPADPASDSAPNTVVRKASTDSATGGKVTGFQQADVDAREKDHQRAIEEHISHSEYRIRLLLRTANMANIDSVLDTIDAIRRSNRDCVKRYELCTQTAAVPTTAEVSPAGRFLEPSARP